MPMLCPRDEKLGAAAICGLFLRGKIAVRQVPLRSGGSTMSRIDR